MFLPNDLGLPFREGETVETLNLYNFKAIRYARSRLIFIIIISHVHHSRF